VSADVELLVDRDAFAELIQLGAGRVITDAWMSRNLHPGYVVLSVQAADAPDGAFAMDPSWARSAPDPAELARVFHGMYAQGEGGLLVAPWEQLPPTTRAALIEAFRRLLAGGRLDDTVTMTDPGWRTSS